MRYLDDKMKKLLKCQAKTLKLATKANELRSKAHDTIDKALANAILKGSYLSIGIWTIPETYVKDTDESFQFGLSTPIKPLNKSWGNILTYMSHHCYRVHLAPDITLMQNDESLEITASDHKTLSAFIKKQGMQVIYPDVDIMINDMVARDRKSTRLNSSHAN